ncbi:MAG: cytochrome-c oxidase, cbb3-type subunit II [Xanthomonadales bacterium]|nr:cytochrome-c oxidase, cbb3-type subunit II [Xanthomonadales bacterium]
MLKHQTIEKNVGLMGILIFAVISLGGIAEIVPLMFQAQVVEPLPGMKPYPPLELAGREVYVSEGCYNCHSQMVRTLYSESARYGHYSVAGESVYDHPFQWGSKRTGPDLARVGGRYSDEWHRVHLNNPRAVVPESNMPGYPWLAERFFEPADLKARMEALRTLGVPYTDEDLASVDQVLAGKSQMDAVIAYLQGLGRYAPKVEPAVATTAGGE